MSTPSESANQIAFNEKLDKLKRIADSIPGSVIIHRLFDFKVEFMSRWGINKLGAHPEDIINLSEKEYHKKYFNPEDAEDYVPKIRALIEKADEDEIVSYFQQVRTGENAVFNWYMSTTRIFLKDGKGCPTHIITVACPIDPEHHISSKVSRLLEENNYLRKHNSIFASLTNREKEVLKLIAIGQNSSEIAEAIHISISTVDTHRKNIKKKINAKSHYDLILFAQAFDLI